jgi:pimeloyl-ACP methyl ester carboxylesterase
MPDLEFVDRQDDDLGLLRKQDGGAGRSLAIFVHGFLGNYLSTWGHLPELLQKHALSEPTLADWDFLFLGYPTRKIASYLDIAHVIATQWDKAATGKPPFKGAYTRVALLGHSLGTLGIRQLLCAGVMQPAKMLDALHSVTLFGTPLNGSTLASYGRPFGGPIAEALEPGNPQLRMLRSWNESVHPFFKWKGVRIVLGLDDQVVGHKFVDLIDFAGDATTAALLKFDHGIW